MNINPTIIAAFASLNVPVEPNHYEGEATEYIIFDYLNEPVVLRGSGTDICDETVIRINYYTKGNTQSLKKSLRRLLRTAGFTVIGSGEFYEADTKYNHIWVEAWIEGIIND